MNKRIPTAPSGGRWSRRILLLLTGSLAPALGWAQQATPPTVSGRIVSAEGEALAGARVELKGTDEGTTTNADGRYTLSVPDEQTVLVVCAIGYVCREFPASRAQAPQPLQPEAQPLPVRQAVGYGTQPARQVPGAIATVSEQQLRDVPVANIGQALQGRVAGVSIANFGTAPGLNPVIRVRGNRSFLGSGDPLVVVDGVPFEGNLNDLNPDDIATVNVLKDAGATAIYGGRAANGVLLLTTRRGQAGAPHVSYSGYAGPKSIYGRYDLQNGQQYYNYRLEAFRAQNASFNPNTASNFLTADERANYAAGRTTDYQQLLFQQGHLQNHTLGLRGGTERTQYAAALGYYDETGIVPVQRFRRYALHGTLDQQVGQRAKVGLSTLTTTTLDDDPNVNVLYQILTTSPLASPTDADGNLVLYPNGDQLTNPLALYAPGAHLDQRRRWRTFNSAYGQVNILKGLDYRANVGVDLRSETGKMFFAASTPQNGGGQSTASYSNAQTTSLLLENLLTYSRTLGQHSWQATALYSRQRYQADYTGAFVMGATGPIAGGGNKSSQEWGLTSLMGRLQYAYADRYSATLTYRNDGSSRLPPGSKYGSFFGAAAAWNLAQERLLAGHDWLSQLKLRASAGRVGNTAGGPFTTLGQDGPTGAAALGTGLGWEYTTSLNAGLDFGFFQNRVAGSLDVYRQRSTGLLLPTALPSASGYGSALRNEGKVQNQGIELALTTVNVRASTLGGFAWSTEWNFTLNREQVLDVGSYDAGGNPRSDLAEQRIIGQPLYVFYDYRKTGIWQTAEADQARRYNSKPGQIKVEDVNGDGKLDASDRQVLGSRQPQFEAGLTSRFRFKGFDLSVVAFTRVGATVVDPVLFGPNYFTTNTGRRNQLNLNYWTPTNPSNDYPQPDQSPRPNEWPTYGSTLGYRDGTFLKVRSLDLGYTLPAAWAGALHLSSARVYARVQNPLIWARDPYFRANKAIDPDALSYSTRFDAAGGLAAANTAFQGASYYPVARAFLGGVTIVF